MLPLIGIAGQRQLGRENCKSRIRLPMRAEVRSLNLAMSAGLAVGEALQQTDGLPK